MSGVLYRCPAVLPTWLPHTRITVTTLWWQHPWEPRCTTTRRRARAASRCQVSCWTTASTSLNQFRFRCRCPSSPLSKSPALVCSQPLRHVAWPEVMPASACSLVCFCCTPVAFRIPKHAPCSMLSTNFYTVVLRQHNQCCIVEHVKHIFIDNSFVNIWWLVFVEYFDSLGTEGVVLVASSLPLTGGGWFIPQWSHPQYLLYYGLILRAKLKFKWIKLLPLQVKRTPQWEYNFHIFKLNWLLPCYKNILLDLSWGVI